MVSVYGSANAFIMVDDQLREIEMEQRDKTVNVGRRTLLQGMGIALLTLAPGMKAIASVFSAPAPVPAGKSVYRVRGKAWVNGERVHEGTVIAPNDTVKTAQGSELVFVVGDHAMILRGGSHLVIEAAENLGAALISGLRLFSGKLMSVSRNPGMRIITPNATIGVRGTGVYLEAGPDKTYFCTCYGEVDVVSNDDASSKQTVVSKHHDMPLYIYRNAPPGQCILHANKASRANHSDEELQLAEALVGRKPPFMT